MNEVASAMAAFGRWATGSFRAVGNYIAGYGYRLISGTSPVS